MSKFESVAVYIRKSTEEQDDQHQREDVSRWLDHHDLVIGEVDVYAEQASGASGDRDEFLKLIEEVEDETYTDIIVWEISRIARKGFLAQRFFDACEEHEAVIHVTNGSVREVRPDGTGRMVAGIIAEVAAEERRTLIRRTKSGQARARREGKWLGQVPTGFSRVDGYLSPIIDADHEAGETGYFELVDALEHIKDGLSFNKAAQRTPNVTRQTLSNIYSDEERRGWYLHQEANDVRVQEAVDRVSV